MNEIWDYKMTPYYKKMADKLTEFMRGSGMDMEREIRNIAIGIGPDGWDETVSRFEPLMTAVIRRANHEEWSFNLKHNKKS